MKSRRIALIAFAALSVCCLCGCETASMYQDTSYVGNGAGTQNGGMGSAYGTAATGRSVQGAAQPQGSATATTRLNTGYSGPVTTPGPGRSGR